MQHIQIKTPSCKAGAVSYTHLVLFNEGWGQFDAVENTEMVRSHDRTRLIDAHSGWFDPVSYTHLDVYKRQDKELRENRIFSELIL